MENQEKRTRNMTRLKEWELIFYYTSYNIIDSILGFLKKYKLAHLILTIILFSRLCHSWFIDNEVSKKCSLNWYPSLFDSKNTMFFSLHPITSLYLQILSSLSFIFPLSKHQMWKSCKSWILKWMLIYYFSLSASYKLFFNLAHFTCKCI